MAQQNFLSTPYYFSTIRYATAAFANLFSNIHIQRLNSDGSVKQTIRVPIAYGPKRAWYTRTQKMLAEDFPLEHSVAMILPRMSFQFTGLSWDRDRTTSPNNRFKVQDIQLAKILANYQGMPWDIQYELNIMVKNTDDGLRIIEQIIPQFKPQVSVQMLEVPELGLTRAMPIIFNDIQVNDQYEEPFTEKQLLQWNLKFTAKSYFYPGITDGSVIKKVNAYINANPNMTGRYETVTTYVDPLSANEWDVDSNGNPAYSIKSVVIPDSNG